MLLGVVSDTHGHIAYTREAVSVLESCGVEVVLHCGDIGSAEIVRLFAPWATHFVFGNVDRDEDHLRAAIEGTGSRRQGNSSGRSTTAGHTCHGRFGSLELEGRRIAFLHGDDTRRLRDETASGRWDLLCYGHSHRAEQHREGETLVLNPGALFRATPHSLALVELPKLEATHVEL